MALEFNNLLQIHKRWELISKTRKHSTYTVKHPLYLLAERRFLGMFPISENEKIPITDKSHYMYITKLNVVIKYL